MNLCYCDESGTGNEPIAVMVGIVVDIQRMHITKQHWTNLLELLSRIAGGEVSELHTRNFYNGNGIWRDMEGPQRANFITAIFDWIALRKHDIVYAAVNKASYHRNLANKEVPDELNTIWRFMGFHLVLAMQKYCQREKKNKGHSIFVFDNEERERMRFTDIIMHPPAWSGEYYGRKDSDEALDQVVDVPYFGDSKEVALIQVADVISFFLRRYAEIEEDLVPPKYEDERERVSAWIEKLVTRSIGRPCIYPKSGRSDAEDLFYQNAPESIRCLG